MTLTINDALMDTLEIEAKKAENQTFDDFVNDTLRLGLRARERMADRKPFRIKSRNLGVYPDINYDKTSELLELIEESERDESKS